MRGARVFEAIYLTFASSYYSLVLARPKLEHGFKPLDFSIERLLDPKIEITRVNLNRNDLRVSPVE